VVMQFCSQRKTNGLVALVLGLLGCAEPAQPSLQPPAALGDPIEGVGMNLATVSYYATQMPFVDLFRNRDAWQSTDGSTWDTELIDSIPADADGYPLALPSRGQTVRASAFVPLRSDSFGLRWKG